jgi:hypothetical protein
MGRGCRTTLIATLLALLLTACGKEVAFQPGSGSGDPTRGPTPLEEVAEDAVWFEVLGVSQEGRDLGEIDLALDAEELAALWERHGFDGAAPDTGFDEHVVLVVVRAENGCPDELVEVRVADGVLEGTYLEPPGGCIDPLIPTAYAVALHRADLPEQLEVVVREHEGHGGDKSATFTLPPYDGPPSPAPSPPAQQPDDDELDAIFADHPIVRCTEVEHIREEAFGDRSGREIRDQDEMTGPPMDHAIAEDVQVAYAAEHPETYGFLVVDEQLGEWTVGVTDDLEAHRERLEARHPDARFRLMLTPNPAAALQEAQERLMPLHGSDDDVQLVSSGAFAYLELGIIDPTREDLDAIAELVDPELVCVDPMLSGMPRTTP